MHRDSGITRIFRRFNALPLQARTVIWFFICSVVQKGIAVIATPFYTRFMTTEEYGHFNVFYSWYEILGVFVSLRIFYGCYAQGVVKFEKDKERFTSSLQGLSLVLVLLWGLILFLFKNPVSRLTNLSVIELYLMLLLIWTNGVYCYWSTYQRTQYRYKGLVAVTLIIAFLKQLLGVLAVLFMDDRVTWRIAAWAFVEFAVLTGLFIRQLQTGKTFFDRRFWKYALCFATPLIPHYLSQTILSGSDRIMIERLVGGDAAGIYSLGYMIAFMMQIVNTALIHTMEPWVYRSIRDGKAGELSSKGLLSMGIVAAADLLLVAVAPEVIQLFAPPSYYEAVYVIAPVTASVFIMYMYTLFAEFEFYYEKTWTITVTTSIAALLNVLLNAVSIPRFGWQAAAYTTLISYLCYSFFHYFMMCRVCRTCMHAKPVYPLSHVLGLTCAVLILTLILRCLYPWRIIRFALLGAALLALLYKRRELIPLITKLLNRQMI